MNAPAAPDASLLSRAVAFARQRPGTVLAWVLGLHLVVWTVLPILVCNNLQLDLAEDLALGREWQFGYWKHPPLPWWLADLVYRATGHIESIYVLGPLAAVVCLYFVWRLGRDVAGPFVALIAVLALEGLHFFNFSAVKFAHDQMQLPFWALTGLFFYRAVTLRRLLDWVLAGAFLALCFWSKYAAFALAATLGLVLLIDRDARAAWRTPGPYAMALAFLIVLGPNLWWLVHHDFLPFRYVDARAKSAEHWYQFITFPLRWTVSQLFYLLPVIGLLALLYGKNRPDPERLGTPFARRYIAALAIGPFLVTTAMAMLTGRLPVAMWGYPLWSFAPLAVLMWFPPSLETVALRRFAAAFAIIFVVLPIAYAAVEELEPLVRDRERATQFPGRNLAATITERWRARTGTPLYYVGGAPLPGGAGEFAANNVAVYSPDRPRVIVHGDPKISPWIDAADVERRGAVFVWQGGEGIPAPLKARFPQLQLQPPLTLPQSTRVPVRPVQVHIAILPPQP